MAGQILIPLNSRHRIKNLIPYLEEVAKPGMRVVFLIPYPVDPWSWLQDHWVTTESSRQAMLAGRKITKTYSRERQKALAEERIAPWHHALHKLDVEVTVDVYTGSLASIVESYNRGGDVSLIMRPQNGLSIMRSLCQTIAFLGLIKRVSFPPVLLLRPDH